MAELETLKKMAFKYTQEMRYFEAQEIWNYLTLQSGTAEKDVYEILYLENCRLSGYLPYIIGRLHGNYRLYQIEEALGVNHGFELMGELVSNHLLAAEDVDHLIKNIGGGIPKNIVQSLCSAYPRELSLVETLDNFDYKILMESDEATFVYTHDEAYSKAYDGIKVVFPDHFPQYSTFSYFRSHSVILMEEVEMTIGSDLIKTPKAFYLDNFSFIESRHTSLSSDPLLVAVDRDSKRFTSLKKDSAKVTVENGFWLGYPASAEWGHWVNEFLTRMAMYFESSDCDDSDMFFIVPEETPSSFLDFAETIWGKVRWYLLPHGASLLIKKLMIVPCRNHISLNPVWNLEMLTSRVNAEKSVLGLFKRHILKVDTSNSSIEQHKGGVFLDRELAKYRRSQNFEVIREIAQRNGMWIVDPGSLSAIDQIALFKKNDFFVGFAGSGWFLSCLAGEGTKGLVIGSDLTTDWVGLFKVLEDEWGQEPSVAIGFRKLPFFGYSEQLYHQDFIISKEMENFIEGFIQRELS